jgi:hypothetical protein
MSQHHPVSLLAPICGHRAYASSLFEIRRVRERVFPRRISIQNSQKAGMHGTWVDLHSRRSHPLAETEFYSQPKLCYITPLPSPILKSKGGGVLMATKKAAKKPAKKAAKKPAKKAAKKK